jgi:hypothetical protein
VLGGDVQYERELSIFAGGDRAGLEERVGVDARGGVVGAVWLEGWRSTTAIGDVTFAGFDFVVGA